MGNWHLLKRKETWVLTWRGWVILLCFGVVMLSVAMHCVYPFLAITRPGYQGILVVEGWLSDAALEEAVATFTAHDYQLLVTTGGPLVIGGHLTLYRTYAELSAATVRKLGLPRDTVVAVSAPPARIDRTFESALAFRNWFSGSGLRTKSLDVYTLGPHARRSHLLYQMALGRNIQVGIIAGAPKYGKDNWRSSSDGIKSVLTELLAYLYARFFFFTDEQEFALP